VSEFCACAKPDVGNSVFFRMHETKTGWLADAARANGWICIVSSLVILVAPLLLNTDDHCSLALHYHAAQHFIIITRGIGEAVFRTMHGHEPTACPDNALGILNTACVTLQR
jgi:hypothetical protein